MAARVLTVAWITALPVLAGDAKSVLKQIVIIGDTLRMSAHVLANDPDQLAAQLLGTLLQEIRFG